MRRVWTLVLGLAAVGCGGSTEPSNRALQVGRYRYTASGTAVRGSLAGTLTLTSATADSVAGSWSVASSLLTFQPAVQLGKWNEDAFVLYARGGDGATYSHRIARAGGGYSCVGLVVLGASFSCAVEYLGP